MGGTMRIRVLAFITAFLIPIFFCAERLEKTVSAEENQTVGFVLKNECIAPIECYITAKSTAGSLRLLRTQNGQSVLLFSGKAEALSGAELYIGTLTAGESMTFTVQCGDKSRAQLVIRGIPQENAAGSWVVRASLIFGWGVLAVGGAALLVRRMHTRKSTKR